MNNYKEIFSNDINKYYKSIDELYKYRLKIQWKYDLMSSLVGICFIWLLLNLITVIPFNFENYFRFLFLWIVKIFSIENIEYIPKYRWWIGIITSAAFLYIAILMERNFIKKSSKKTLNPKLMKFCHIYNFRSELLNYLTNKNEQHLENAKEIYKKSFTNISVANINTKKIHLKNLRETLIKQFEWIDFDVLSNNMIHTLSSFKSKIYYRIKEKTEIGNIIPLFDLLTVYEYAKINPETLDPYDNKKLGDKKFSLLHDFTNLLIALSKIEIATDKGDDKRNRLKPVIIFLINLFSSQNILVLLCSWLLLLSVMFMIPAYIVIINVFQITIDSNIAIGMITAPFLGSIAISVAIFTKKHK